MEDYRDNLVVIVAGYPDLMKKFIDSNPGLASRFNRYINFEDYTESELYKIFECFCKKNSYTLDAYGSQTLKYFIHNLYIARDEKFGNAKNDSIYGDEGNDTIWAWNSNILVDGGADNDYIYAGNYETNTSIYGGAGDDTIVNFNSESYIGGGKGNDLIYNDNQLNNIFLYDSGDGTDTIYGYNANDTIKITGEKYSTVKSGNDLKISVGTGSILLKDIANTTINISGTLKGDNSDAETLPTGITIRNSVLTASNKFTGNTINLNNEWSNSVTKVNTSAISRSCW